MQLHRLWNQLERQLDGVAGCTNPLRHLGSLALLALWLMAGTGIWLFAVLQTSATGSYESITALSQRPWAVGALMRSVHRYAADAFVLFVALHLVRELVKGHWRHFRRFTWLTGTALLPIMAISAIGGFWLSWDRLAQFSATASMELLDALPLLGSTLARNFIGSAQLSDRLFSLFVFVHVGMALLLVFGLWFHLQRLARAAVFPPRAAAVALVGALLALAAVSPVTSQGLADLATVPQQLRLDWFILSLHPLMYATSAQFVWLLLGSALLLLLLLPLLPTRLQRAPVAVVDADNCSGCTWCAHDCPYAAIRMAPHPSGRPGQQIAVVDAALCAGCGICAGSCPSSTPFRGLIELVTGIDLPQRSIDNLRSELRAGLAQARSRQPGGRGPLVLLACDHGVDAATLAAADVVLLPLLCIGQLPPSFIGYALRQGAAGVVVAGCRSGGCEFRHGPQLNADRLAGQRPPVLTLRWRESGRHWSVAADAGEEAVLRKLLDRVRADLIGARGPLVATEEQRAHG